MKKKEQPKEVKLNPLLTSSTYVVGDSLNYKGGVYMVVDIPEPNKIHLKNIDKPYDSEVIEIQGKF